MKHALSLLKSILVCTVALTIGACHGSDPAPPVTLGGLVKGLSGTVILTDGSGTPLPVTSDGSFTFPEPIPAGSSYSVTVQTQPAGEVCTVGSGMGVAGSKNITSIMLVCSANAFTIGGTVAGLAGSLVLQNDGGDIQTLTSNGPFTFSTAVAEAGPYAVTGQTQPVGQTCSVSNGAGTMGSAPVTDITVVCSENAYTVGGVVSGLTGSLVLQDNGDGPQTISGNGAFTFTTPVADGSAYAVTVKTQPAGQTCAVSNGSGTMAASNVSTVTVACTTNSFNVGGTVAGLSGTVVLVDNGGDSLSIVGDGAFTFPTPVAQGSTYAVTVQTQPDSQTCTVGNGSGTLGAGNITAITVTCVTNTFTLGGTVSGLTGTLVLKNGADTVSISGDGAFVFPTSVAQGRPYAVVIQAQPSLQTCGISNSSGVMGTANVVNVAVTCSTNTYTIGGTISGLVGNVTLQDNGGNTLTLSGASGSFRFLTPATAGSTYAITVKTQPANQTCMVSNSSGTVGSGNITNVTVVCSINSYSVGGVISGLIGTLVLRDNGSDAESVSTDGPFTFPVPVAEGSAYNVIVQTQPVGQTCAVTNGTGTMGAANINNVTVVCNTNAYTVGGSVVGLVGTVVLQDNLDDSLPINSDGTFVFSTPVAQGSTYAVTIQTQPAAQTCTVANGTGTIGMGNVTGVVVTCSTNSYTVGGTISGLNGSLVLQQNGADALSATSNGAFTFPTPLAEGSFYSVTVQSQPASQTCTVSNGTGTMGAANVTNVNVICIENTTTISVSATAVIAVNGSAAGIVVTNTGTTNTAFNVQAMLPGGWTGVTQDASGCVAIAPNGGTCTLLFTSTLPYVAQGSIQISGDNVTSPPTTALAFSVSGYLVFSVDSLSSVSVIDTADLGIMAWGSSVITNATSLTDGVANTSTIVATAGVTGAATSCFNSTAGGASVGTWYLPAVCQLGAAGGGAGCAVGQANVYNNLFQLGFGGFDPSSDHWSSTEATVNPLVIAWGQVNQLGAQALFAKSLLESVRCARSVSY